MDAVATAASDDESFIGSLVNRVVGGKYRIVSYLASGGVGAVYAAEHIGLGERVALKFLSSEWADDSAIAERFLREARTQFKIASEHVTRVLDVGTTDWGTAYLVMELVAGESLRDLVDRVGSVQVEHAAEIVRQASLGLAAAHELGVVHRDVKGGNMMLAERNGKVCVKVLDFGLADVRSLIEHRVMEARLTPPSLVMGTPLYMAPEQLRGARHATSRSDVWSMGVVLYELLTGEKPFDLLALAQGAHNGSLPPIVPVRDRVAEVPLAVSNIVARCLSFDPDDRFKDGGELAKAVAPFAHAFSFADLVPHRADVARPAEGLTFAKVKVASADGHTAFEVHELVELRAGSQPHVDLGADETTELDAPASGLESTIVPPAEDGPPRSVRVRRVAAALGAVLVVGLLAITAQRASTNVPRSVAARSAPPVLDEVTAMSAPPPSVPDTAPAPIVPVQVSTPLASAPLPRLAPRRTPRRAAASPSKPFSPYVDRW